MRIRSCVFLEFCPPTRPRARLRCAHDTDSSALVKAPVPRPYSRFLPQTERPNGRKNDRSDDERLYMNDWAAYFLYTSLEPSRAATRDQEENVDCPLTMGSLTFAEVTAAAPAPVGSRRCGHSKPQIATSQLILFSLGAHE